MSGNSRRAPSITTRRRHSGFGASATGSTAWWAARRRPRCSASRSFAARCRRRWFGNGNTWHTCRRRSMTAKRVGRPKGSKNAVDVVVVERSHPAAVASATLAGRRRRPAPSAAVPAAASTGAAWSRSAPASAPTARPTHPSSRRRRSIVAKATAAGAGAWTAAR